MSLNFLIAAWSNSHPFSDCLSSNSSLRFKGFFDNPKLYFLISPQYWCSDATCVCTANHRHGLPKLSAHCTGTITAHERWESVSTYLFTLIFFQSPHWTDGVYILCIYMVSYASVQLQELLCMNILERSQMYTVGLCGGTLSWKNDISHIKQTFFSIQSN